MNIVQLFTTIRRLEGESRYSNLMKEYFKKNEEYGFCGSLIFQNNTNDIDPWVIAQELLMRSGSLIPFIAVNPIYMHPYTVARKILSFGELYDRKTYLNFITGTSISDLESVEALLSHEDRYVRLVEYMEIINHLLTSLLPLSYEGRYYRTKNLRLPGVIDRRLLPQSFIAGSSKDAQQARARTGACKLGMAKPINEANLPLMKGAALHFGIIACSSAEAARERLVSAFSPRYPEARQLLDLSMLNTDSVWKKELQRESGDEIFRLEPFNHFNADCPYLVGSYEQVAAYLIKYIKNGSTVFVIEADEKELDSIHTVIEMVKDRVPDLVD
jgi:alkanesulfonate monooxygenase